MTPAAAASSHLTAVVAVKSVPVGGRPLRVVDGALTRDGVSHGIDGIDEVGVEWAVRARATGALGEVVAVTMGPAAAADALRRALAIGADRGVHVTDPRLEGSDVVATATVLAAAARHVGARLAVLGHESADGSSGAVPAATAARLGWPLLTRVRDAEVDGRLVRAQLSTASGTRTVEAELPVVCSVVEGSVTARYPSVQDMLRARRQAVLEVDAADLGVTPPAGPPRERVVAVEPVDRPRVEPVVTGPDVGVDALLDVLSAVRRG